MFSIDLLKGKGLPRQSDLKGTLLKAVPLIIPLIAVAALAASYQQDYVKLKSQQTQLKQNQSQIQLNQPAMKQYSQINRQISDHRKVLKDVAKAMSYRIQVTDLLVEMVGILPVDIVVSEMNFGRQTRTEKVKNEETGQEVKFLVIDRVLTLVLCRANQADGNQAVQEYMEQLNSSERLSEFFDDFRLAARRQGQIDEESVTYYEIECVFHEQR
ncbi:MAG: hypothetical protein ACYTET_03820 [Planctomycetota bacterium]|jgi:hypothetical protein